MWPFCWLASRRSSRARRQAGEDRVTKAKLGIGILSFAHGHVGVYASQIRGFDDARLVACWDHDQARGQASAEQFGMPFCADLDDVLKRPDIDCVIIGSETNRHTDLACAAMEAGKAVLLQKPMAITLADCDRIIQTARRTGVWFSLAFQMRCDPQNIRMRELIRDGAVGHVGTVRRRHCIGALFNRDFVEGATHWHVTREANRGMFFDDATHALDWLYWTLGKKPVSVMAEVDNVLTHVAPDDTGAAIFRFDGGEFGCVYNSSVTYVSENTTEVYGDRGVIIQNYGDGPSCQMRPEAAVGVRLYQADHADLGWQDQGIPVPPDHGQRIAAVARVFVDSFRAGVPICSAEDGRVSVEMCLAAYHSAETGRRVSFPFKEE